MLQAQWLIRSLEGKLRIGLAEKTVQVALAHAIVLTRTDLQGALPDSWWGLLHS
jgi:DNA ligase-1